jgi:hypothetical protein
LSLCLLSFFYIPPYRDSCYRLCEPSIGGLNKSIECFGGIHYSKKTFVPQLFIFFGAHIHILKYIPRFKMSVHNLYRPRNIRWTLMFLGWIRFSRNITTYVHRSELRNKDESLCLRGQRDISPSAPSYFIFSFGGAIGLVSHARLFFIAFFLRSSAPTANPCTRPALPRPVPTAPHSPRPAPRTGPPLFLRRSLPPYYKVYYQQSCFGLFAAPLLRCDYVILLVQSGFDLLKIWFGNAFDTARKSVLLESNFYFFLGNNQ